MKMRFAAVAAIAITAGLAGCSSDNSDRGTPSESSSQATTIKPQFLTKMVGAEGGWACETKDYRTCALAFTVTKIEPISEAQCGEYASYPDGHRLIQVSLDARGQHQTPPPNAQNPPGLLLLENNWYATDKDGYSAETNSVFCSAMDNDYGPFSTPVDVGQKSRGTVVLAIPQGSTTLDLRDAVYRGSWRWSIPAS